MASLTRSAEPRTWPTSPAACAVVADASAGFFEEEDISDAGLGEPIGDRAADRAAAHDHKLGVAKLAHLAEPRVFLPNVCRRV